MMLDEPLIQDIEHEASIGREVILPLGGDCSDVTVTGLSWAPEVYDYVFSGDMNPHEVSKFLQAAAEASMLEISVPGQEDII